MPDLVTAEAVEAAARAYIESGLPNVPRRAGRHYHAMHAALTAAAPHIAAQALDGHCCDEQAERAYRRAMKAEAENRDLRAGIEALRDEWRMHEAANLRAASTQPENSSGLLLHTAIAGLCKAHAAALDALLGGAANV